ncbi:MAG: peptidase domain-containing ABC transporter, partial [Vampirovibrionia bacterium]
IMQTGLISFEVISKLNQQDVDIRSIIREYGINDQELSRNELMRIIKDNGFKAKLKTIEIHKTSKYPLPAIFIFNDQSYGVLLKVNYDENKALLFLPVEKTTKEVTFEEFKELSTGELFIMHHKIFNDNVKFGFKWFYKEILKYKQIIGEVLIGSFIVQLFGLITPLFTQVILDKVIVHHSMTTLVVIAIAFIAIVGLEFLLNIVRNYIFLHTANKIDAKLGSKLFRHLFSLPFNYFENRKVGNIIARVRELDVVREFITNKSVSVIIDLFFSFVFVLVMFLYSVKLTLIVLGFVSIIAIIYLIITPELRNRLNYKFQMGAQSNSYLVESVTGIQTVKSLAIEGSMQKKWEDYLGNYVNSSFKLSNLSNITGSFSKLLQKLMTLFILYLGVKLVIENKLTIGQLIAFQMFANQFSGPVLRLVNLWNEFQQALLGVDRLSDILNHPIEVKSSKAITLPKVEGAIKIDNISFKYNTNTPNVLTNLSFNVLPGTSIGLIGRSGSGKSTITKLIQRLYIPNEGSIYLDGIDVRHLNPTWLRYNIGVVLQENYLFSGTIRENITLPKPEASIELIIQASQIAGAHDFISELPEGYDTMVGERGSSLSGGQKQRIAIARALITNPKILIFDEATSALDYESEKLIVQNLNQIKKGRTTFIIAHRLSTVRKCDIIIALDQGRIIEIGSHEQLINNKGYYYKLFTMQETLSKD